MQLDTLRLGAAGDLASDTLEKEQLTASDQEGAPFTFDLQDALAPISAEHPSGESLRYEGLFDEIKELRREDDPTLPQGVWKRQFKKADWEKVASQSIEALRTRTKDLQVSAWLIEAWIHLYGFPGLEQGFKLAAGLCEDFWDDLHPQVAEGLEFRLAPVEWMASKLVWAVKSVAVTRPSTDEAIPYSWGDWEKACHFANLIKADKLSESEAEAQGKLTQPKFLVSASLTSSAFFVRLAEELQDGAEAVNGLVGLLEEKCGEAAPSFVDLLDALEATRRYALRNLKERMEEEGGLPESSEEVSEALLDLDEEVAVVPAGGPITGRADAFRRLNQAADYLLRTEPHSPAPYLVKRAVSWGNLSLAELLQELLEQNTDVDSIYKLLGIKHMDSS